MPDLAASRASLDALVAYRLGLAGRLIRTLADGELAELGVAGPSLGVLIRLLDEDGPTQTELARRQRVEPPTMCRMIDRLERDGLVSRVPDPADRRATRIELRPRGRRVAERGLAVVREIDDGILDALDDRERESLFELLDKVIDALPPGGGS